MSKYKFKDRVRRFVRTVRVEALFKVIAQICNIEQVIHYAMHGSVLADPGDGGQGPPLWGIPKLHK